ncbi:MAG: DUF433 domain-containing protein [Acidobacteriaceae bacterium]|nr:DUF433 domain-containing protein [Acidobacteriaceae bacterium]MBV9767120.1 DUF433 domain-containing protein [Acidobacteriaceae bacterium]
MAAAHPRITVEADKRSGSACIRGMRITVNDVLDMLANGMTEQQILDDFPYLEKEDFPAIYRWRAGLCRSDPREARYSSSRPDAADLRGKSGPTFLRKFTTLHGNATARSSFRH